MAYQPKSYRKFIATAAAVAVVAPVVAPAAFAAASFSDIEGTRYAEAVTTLAEAGIVKGNEDGTFTPYSDITRGEAAIIVARALDLLDGENIPANPFTDVGENTAAFEAIAKLAEAGIIGGYDAETFGPYDQITRGQMAKVLAGAFELELGDGETDFSDVATDGTFAKHVDAIVDAGFASGKEDGTFGYSDNILRGDFAVMINNALTEDVDPIVDPEVESVSAINAKQIQVTFATAMDKDSVTDVTKYAVKRAGESAVALTDSSADTDADAKLSEDGKTLTITLDNALISDTWGSIAEGDTFNVELDELKTADGQKIAKQSVAVVYSDKVAPEFVSASASAKDKTREIKVTFNEPVSIATATATIDGKSATLSAGSKPNEVKVTATKDLVVGTAYELSILNIKDAAGNLIKTNPVKATVTVAGDTVAPKVTDIKVVRDNLLEVSFDKSMDASTITNTSIKVLDANLNATGITQGAVTVKSDTDNKTFLVPLTAVPFKEDGSFNGVVSVANTVKDKAGNAIAAVTKNLSLTEDETAPTVVSSSYKKVNTYDGQATANGVIVVKFSEDITASAANTAYTVVNDKGVEVATPISSVFVNSDDDTELVLVLNAAVATDVDSYKVVLPASAVVDQSLATNASKAANLTVDVSAGAPVADDDIDPVVSGVVETAATSATSGTTIAVTFTEVGGLDTVSASNVNNYRLDGAALPEGSYITVASNVATINIPANTISDTKDYALNIDGVLDKAGNQLVPYVGTVTLEDDIAPELTSATLNANGTVSLGFSEDVIPGVGTEADFAITLDGVLLDASAYTIADGTGSDDGKYVLEVVTEVSESAGAGGTDTLFIDVNDNGLDAADIILSEVDDDTATTGNNFTAGTFDLNDAATLKVGTVASPSLVQDTNNTFNTLKGNKIITLK